MIERRKFLRGAGLLGLVAAGISAAAKETMPAPVLVHNTHIHNETPKTDLETVRKIESANPGVLQLQCVYGERVPTPQYTQSPYIISGLNDYIPGTKKEMNVKMVAGPDGELYLNTNGQWKKVLTTT